MRSYVVITIGATERMALREDAGLRDFCAGEYPRLLGTLTLLCGDRALGEELAQEALARACAAWPKVRRMDAPGAWVHRVGVNLANSYFRRRASEKRARARLESQPDTTQVTSDTDLDVVLRREVAALPKRQRSALVLRYFGDFSVRATAEALGVAEGTVKRLTHEAIASLRKNPRLAGLEVGDD